MTDTSVKSALSREGWHLNDDGYAVCLSACADDTASPHEIALNQDLRKIGSQCLPNSICRGVPQEVKAPLILQIQKVTNIAVPSYHQHDGGGVRLLKLQLTDGHVYCNALELKHTPQLKLSMPPGTKLKITSDVMARNGFLLLTPTVVKVLGGHVNHMVEKWEANKVMMERSKVTGDKGDGPPAFVPFTNATNKSSQHSSKPVEQASSRSSVTMPPQKHGNQQDVKVLVKQVDRQKAQEDRTHEVTSHKQTGGKPHHYHQRKPPHQHGRYHQDRPFHGEPSKQRTHVVNPQYKRSKGHPSHASQSSSSEIPQIAFNNEEHFPALPCPTSQSQPRFTPADDRQQRPPPHRPILAWDTSTTTTGGSIPFSAKRNT